MSKKSNVSLIANGEVCGFPSEIGIAFINGEMTLAGILDTQGKPLDSLFRSSEIGVRELSERLTVLPKNGTGFTVSFIKKSSQTAFSLVSSGMVCGR